MTENKPPSFAFLEEKIEDTQLTERQRFVTAAIIDGPETEITIEVTEDFGTIQMSIGGKDIAFTADQARHVALVTEAVDDDWADPAFMFKSHIVAVARMVDKERKRDERYREPRIFKLNR